MPDAREASFSMPGRTGKMTWFPLGFAAAAALAIAYAGWWRTAPVTAERPTPFTLTASTDVGRQREVIAVRAREEARHARADAIEQVLHLLHHAARLADRLDEQS